MTGVSNVHKIFDIIAEEIGVERDELIGDCEFADLGVDKFLAKSILSQIEKEIGLLLPATTFDDYPTVDDLQSHLCQYYKASVAAKTNGGPPSAIPVSSGPLSFVLQGKPETCNKILFLLPDGSGSGMAYARLPPLDPSICLIALNSPYLKAPTSTKFTLEDLAAHWTAEIQSRQPHGPYFLGGWSAGGYYSFEVTKHLMRRGEKVEKLILIDSPCRLVYEALPMEVVEYLSTNNLMGNWGGKNPPEWMVNHFDISIRSIQKYMPTPMQGFDMPDVHIIWAGDGVLKCGERWPAKLNSDVRISRMLMQRTETEGALGWERLFPGARIEVAKMPGNHFTIVYPPNCASLSLLLRDSVQDHKADRRGQWKTAAGTERVVSRGITRHHFLPRAGLHGGLVC